MLLGREPAFEQVSLYEKFPGKRGYSLPTPDPILFEASFLLAFMQTFAGDAAKPNDVLFIVAPELNGWVSEQMTRVAQEVIGGCKRYGNAAVRAQHLGALFRHVRVARSLPPMAPIYGWATFGFDPQAGPEWFREALL